MPKIRARSIGKLQPLAMLVRSFILLTSIILAGCTGKPTRPARVVQPKSAPVVMAPTAQTDFVRLPWAYGENSERVLHRFELNCRAEEAEQQGCLATDEPGDLLARIWTRFGPPQAGVSWERFSYVFLHVPSRSVIVLGTWKGDVSYEGGTKYVGPIPAPAEPTGLAPARLQREQFANIVKEFERSLLTAEPADCLLIDDTDELVLHRFGARGGKAFYEPLTFEQTIDFYVKLIDTFGPEQDIPIYHLGRPQLRLLFVWLDASDAERGRRPAALTHAKSAWLRELDELERGNRADLGQSTINFLRKSAGTLQMDPSALARVDAAEARLNAELARQEQLIDTARKLCGSQKTGAFVGHYELSAAETTGKQPLSAEQFAALQPLYSKLEIKPDRIVFGSTFPSTFCLTRIVERTPTALIAEALVEGGFTQKAQLTRVRLQRESDGLVTLSVVDTPEQRAADSWLLRFRKR